MAGVTWVIKLQLVLLGFIFLAVADFLLGSLVASSDIGKCNAFVRINISLERNRFRARSNGIECDQFSPEFQLVLPRRRLFEIRRRLETVARELFHRVRRLLRQLPRRTGGSEHEWRFEESKREHSTRRADGRRCQVRFVIVVMHFTGCSHLLTTD